MGVGGAHGDGEPLGELAVGVDHLGDAGRRHRAHGLGRVGAADGAQTRVQQPGRHGDGEVGPIVRGQRQDAAAFRAS